MRDLQADEKLTTADIATPRQARAEAMERATGRTDEDELRPIPLPATSATTDAARTANPAQTMNTPAVVHETDAGPLFPDDELHNFRSRWDQVQTSFVDEPRDAVAEADSLVANVVKRIAEQFAAERSTLENQWSKGNNVNTEDLRQALRRYRSFFDRLLAF